AFDSWSQAPAMALRDMSAGHLRRIRLERGNISVEIVAEKQQSGWEFVARIRRDDEVLHDFVMKVGSRKLLAKSGGFFQWSSKSVPHEVSLTSFKQDIAFERLSWQ
ncbi:MAG: hypothetical protein V3T31_00460, partial [candidate division Zixibacteria bacterium]